MPRKSTVAELQAEEATVPSPIRRSSRRTSTTQEAAPAPTTPARATRGRRRSSAQDNDEGVEVATNVTSARATRGRRASTTQEGKEIAETKPTTAKTRRASLLAEEETKAATPTRRGRKPSTTTEPSVLESEDTEKSKTVRGRRTSTTSTNSELNLPVTAEEAAPTGRGRRKSVSVEPTTELTAKTPIRATKRRTSTTSEPAEEATPAKRTTRGRKASEDKEQEAAEAVPNPARREKSSNTDENEEPEKKGTLRSRKKSENGDLAEESSKSTARKRRLSIDSVQTPKTPGTSRIRRISTKSESEPEILELNFVEDNNEALSDNEDISLATLKDSVSRLTPVKKKKVLEPLVSELDLSVINESFDDADLSKQEEALKENLTKEDLRLSQEKVINNAEEKGSPSNSNLPKTATQKNQPLLFKKDSPQTDRVSTSGSSFASTSGSFTSSSSATVSEIHNFDDNSSASTAVAEPIKVNGDIPSPEKSNLYFKSSPRLNRVSDTVKVVTSETETNRSTRRSKSKSPKSPINNRSRSNTPVDPSLFGESKEITESEAGSTVKLTKQRKLITPKSLTNSNSSQFNTSVNFSSLQPAESKEISGLLTPKSAKGSKSSRSNTPTDPNLLIPSQFEQIGPVQSPDSPRRSSRLRKTKSPKEISIQYDGLSIIPSQNQSDETNTVNRSLISEGSDGSFRLNLNISLNNTVHDKKENLDDSIGSQGSNKENQENINTLQVTDTIEKSALPARVSNAKERSFCEPMDVDQSVFLNASITSTKAEDNVTNIDESINIPKEMATDKSFLIQEESTVVFHIKSNSANRKSALGKPVKLSKDPSKLQDSGTIHPPDSFSQEFKDGNLKFSDEKANKLKSAIEIESAINSSKIPFDDEVVEKPNTSETAKQKFSGFSKNEQPQSDISVSIKVDELSVKVDESTVTGAPCESTRYDFELPPSDNDDDLLESDNLSPICNSKILNRSFDKRTGDSGAQYAEQNQSIKEPVAQTISSGNTEKLCIAKGTSKSPICSRVSTSPEFNQLNKKNSPKKNQIQNDAGIAEEAQKGRVSKSPKFNKIIKNSPVKKNQIQNDAGIAEKGQKSIIEVVTRSEEVSNDVANKRNYDLTTRRSNQLIEKNLPSKYIKSYDGLFDSDTEEETFKVAPKKLLEKSTKTKEKDISNALGLEIPSNIINKLENSKLSDVEIVDTETEEDDQDLNNEKENKEDETINEADEESLDEEDKYEENEFIDGMAEEGEEDTPSEGSNDIIDKGESIGSSDSEEQQDDEYENDSFVCDDEEIEKLSGEEYDLGDDKREKRKKCKKSRIINVDQFDEDEIIKIPSRKQSEEQKSPKQRIRIISVNDSSEDEARDISEETKKDLEITDNLEERDDKMKYINNFEAENTIASIETINKQLKDKESTICLDSPEYAQSKIENEFPIKVCEETGVVNVMDQLKDVETAVTLGCHNTSPKRVRKSSINIHESLVLDGSNDKLGKRINSLVETFCHSVQGEVLLNLSLEFEDKKSSTQIPSHTNSPSKGINIISDIKITPNQEYKGDTQPGFSKDHIEYKALRKSLSTSFDKPEDSNVKKSSPKKRMSVTLSDIEVASLDRESPNKGKRLSKSFEDISQTNKDKKNLRKRKNKKKHFENLKTSQYTTENLKHGTFNLMNDLVTDVKNRPRRTIKPTTPNTELNTSWVVSPARNIKPSKRERIQPLASKFHPKDFKNQILSDTKRVHRVDTHTLIKKKGIF